ncbi:hypothetical protein [Winogradskyella sp. A3E31]|uniref:hypothetical protein n=1 Tax=Winogradskyella sp. A3E31 TaxID=3349637 RepID=UPI00398B7DE2
MMLNVILEKTKFIFSIGFFLLTSFLYSQVTLKFEELYVNGDLAFKISNDSIFTGIAEGRRRNGHLVYEEYYKAGELIKSISYYNRTETPVSAMITEYYSNSFDRN